MADPKKITWVADGIGYRVKADGERSYCIDYFDAAGKRVRSFKNPETGEPLPRERDAKDALAQVVVRRVEGLQIVKTNVRFEEFANEWLERQVDARPSTVWLWRTNLRNHVFPAYGRIEMAKFSEAHLRDLILTKKREGKAGATIKNICQPVRLILDEAVTQRILATNPWTRVPKKERPRQGAVEKRILTLDEVDKLLAHARGTGRSRRVWALVNVLVYTGFRAGEALGLWWEDVDLEAGVIRLRWQLNRQIGERSELKTKAAKRDIPIARELRTVLVEWKLQSPHSGGKDYVFATASGAPMKHRDAHRRIVKLALGCGINAEDEEAAGQPNLDLHSLRHVFASAMIRAYKGDLEAVAALTGHADVKVLADTYSHVFEAVRGGVTIAERAAVIDAAFGG